MHAYACAYMHTCLCMHELVFISMYMRVHAYMCMCMHMCVYVHFSIPSPILKLASLALHPHIEKASYAYVTCIPSRETPFLNIGISQLQQHTIGLSGHHRPANETYILMVFRWRADSGPIYMGLVARTHVQG